MATLVYEDDACMRFFWSTHAISSTFMNEFATLMLLAPYSSWNMIILSNGGHDMSVNFLMWHFWHIKRWIFLGFKLGKKWKFNIVDVISTLCQSRLGSDNLQCLVMITKNWFDDVCERCVGNTNCSMIDFLLVRKTWLTRMRSWLKKMDSLKMIFKVNFKFSR